MKKYFFISGISLFSLFGFNKGNVVNVLSYNIIHKNKVYNIDIYHKDSIKLSKLKINDSCTVLGYKDSKKFTLLIQVNNSLNLVEGIDEWVTGISGIYQDRKNIRDTTINGFDCTETLVSMNKVKLFTMYQAKYLTLPYDLSLYSFHSIRQVPIKIDMETFIFDFTSLGLVESMPLTNYNKKISIHDFYKFIRGDEYKFRIIMGLFNT